ncbi:MFS transporter [Streptomyces sp. NPDC048629]|uniref:MFS transporter n=1 Tax=Streptomyces sp. NPDC048629 TaxID=3154824 RepID=UPI003415A053
MSRAPFPGRLRETRKDPFPLLLTAASVSAVGDGVRLLALPLAAAGIDPDPRALSLVFTAQFVPWLLLGLPGGALVDRVDRRRLVVGVDAIRALIAAAAGIMIALGHASVALLAALGFLLACGEILHESASAALLPEFVGGDRLEHANSRLQAGQLVGAKLAGPLLGTVLWTTGHGVCFVVDALSYGLSALLLRRLPPCPAPGARAAGPGAGRQALAGLRHLLSHPRLRALVVVDAALTLVASALLPILVLFCRQVLHLQSTGFGLVMLASAVGGVGGALLAVPATALLGRGGALSASVALNVIALGAGALTSQVWLALPLLMLFGAGAASLAVLSASLRQAETPADLLGRVSSCHLLLTVGVSPIGAVLGGQIAHIYGVRAPLEAGALLLAVAGAVTAPALLGSRRLGTPGR